jgi:predicted double-glycine peptidase
MVLDYYHQYDTDLQTATISQFISTLNPGDITAENGIYIHKIIDHLKALGYQHTFYMMKPTMTLNRLKVFMIDGPVIVQLGVKLGYQPRRILGVGDYQHATVLLGMSIDEQTVLVNDPWSGSQLELPMVEFLDMWDRSNNIALMIRP